MKSARMVSIQNEGLLLSQPVATAIYESAAALKNIVRVVLMGALLLAVLRVMFEVSGSHSSSIAETVTTLSQWLLVPFSQFSALGASIAAVVALALINGIFTSLESHLVKEAA